MKHTTTSGIGKKQRLSTFLMGGALFGCYLLLLLFFGSFFTFTGTAEPTYVNDTSLSRLNVSNYVPSFSNIIVDDNVSTPANEIDLVAGDNITIWCNGTVRDENGIDDLINVNATFQHFFNNTNQMDDLNTHYTNTSCNRTVTGPYTEFVSCGFTVTYFANNGTWVCTLAAQDNGTLDWNQTSFTNRSNDTVLMNTLFAVDLDASVVDFGSLEPGLNSTNDSMVNVTNVGNTKLRLDVYAYGNSSNDGTCMMCEIGNISVGKLKFDVNESNDTSSTMIAAANSPVNARLNVSQRTDDTAGYTALDTNTTFWKIEVPYGVTGFCNGTLVFVARQP